MTQDVKVLSLSGTKLVLASEIYSYKTSLLLLLLYIKNIVQVKKYDSRKFHNYFLTATNKIISESPSILYYIIVISGYHR